MSVHSAGPEDLNGRIVELEDLVSKLEHDLIHDPLTRLKTRAFFEQEIGIYLEIISQHDEASQRKERFGFRNLSIMFFDIDHFKKVNDTYGHDVGDAVLIKVAETIQSHLRTGDTAARWGGEEILVSLLGASEADAALKAEEIRQRVEKINFAEMSERKVTVSAGIAASEKEVDIRELIHRADQALYKAKGSGRNQVATYSSLDEN